MFSENLSDHCKDTLATQFVTITILIAKIIPKIEIFIVALIKGRGEGGLWKKF